jgi:hypothetical protein
MNDHTPSKPLPATVADLRAVRKVQPVKTLSDEVDQINEVFWEDPAYHSLLKATRWSDETVEGSINSDNNRAAMIIRQYATEHAAEFPLTAAAQLQAIINALGVALRRHGLGRAERARAAG